MEKSIRVRVLGRDYALRVSEEDEAATREIAAYVDGKMRSFHRAFPDQPELTTAIVAALAIAEEFFSARDSRDRQLAALEPEINRMDERLREALSYENQEAVGGEEQARRTPI